MGILVLFIFAGCVTISSAVSCYDCTENGVFFSSLTGSFRMTNCTVPNPTINDFMECNGTCLTRLSLSSSSFLSVVRSCEEDDTYITPIICTNPSDCRLYCNSDRCNNATLDDIIQNNRLGQTCYDCQHSEIPSAGNFNPDCGLDFDPEGMGTVGYSFCQGLCYSAVTFIEGVEDVRRGCMSAGSSCDRANNPYLEDKSVGFGSLDYDMKCCLGSLCNRAQSVSATTSFVLISLTSYVLFLALSS